MTTATVASPRELGICPFWGKVDNVDQTKAFGNPKNVIKNGTQVTITYHGRKLVQTKNEIDNGQPGNEVSVVLISGYDGYYPANGLSLNWQILQCSDKSARECAFFLFLKWTTPTQSIEEFFRLNKTTNSYHNQNF